MLKLFATYHYLLRRRRNTMQRRRSVCDCCSRNRLQRRGFSLVTNIVALTRMRTGCESSHQFLEAQVITCSLAGWTVAGCPARWGEWTSALITLSSAVLLLSLTTPTFPLSPCCLCTGMILLRRRPAIYASEQVCIRWHRTVWGAYYTNVRIIFEFLWYVLFGVQTKKFW